MNLCLGHHQGKWFGMHLAKPETLQFKESLWKFLCLWCPVCFLSCQLNLDSHYCFDCPFAAHWLPIDCPKQVIPESLFQLFQHNSRQLDLWEVTEKEAIHHDLLLTQKEKKSHQYLDHTRSGVNTTTTVILGEFQVSKRDLTKERGPFLLQFSRPFPRNVVYWTSFYLKRSDLRSLASSSSKSRCCKEFTRNSRTQWKLNNNDVKSPDQQEDERRTALRK